MSSFPKHSTFFKLFGTLIVVIVLSSLAVIAAKKCHKGIIDEEVFKDVATEEDKRQYIRYYYIKLHVLHSISLFCGSVIIVLAFIDVVPNQSQDQKYAFHLISILAILAVGCSAFYGSYIAFQKPCGSSATSKCCEVMSSPKLFQNSGRPSATALSEKDKSMIAVMSLDAIAALLLVITALVYYVDMLSDAKQSGYLSRVHNFNYLSRI